MIRFSLRLSDELQERIRKLAERDNRSINAQMITMLEAEVKRQEKERK